MKGIVQWQSAIHTLHKQGTAFAIVTVIGVQGSAPRESGAKMVVSENEIYGSIGGGNLEFESTKIARNLLQEGRQAQKVEYFPLSAKLGQCCAGAVSVMFESFPSIIPTIAIFGAGHVSKALVTILSQLDYRVVWVDQRSDQFPKKKSYLVSTVVSDNPKDEIEKLDSKTIFIVMTHNHDLDFELCTQILRRDSVSYLGLIGSKTKALRFRKKLAHVGLTEQQISKLESPIGKLEVSGKKPMEVAVSIAANIISLTHSGSETNEKNMGLNWKETIKLLDPIKRS